MTQDVTHSILERAFAYGNRQHTRTAMLERLPILPQKLLIPAVAIVNTPA